MLLQYKMYSLLTTSSSFCIPKKLKSHLSFTMLYAYIHMCCCCCVCILESKCECLIIIPENDMSLVTNEIISSNYILKFKHRKLQNEILLFE